MLIEILEERRMLSRAVQWTSGDQTLIIRGTDANDAIAVSTSAATPNLYVISINGKEKRIARKWVHFIYVEGLGGNDRIDLRQMHAPRHGVNALGGAGNDLLIGGANDEDLDGNEGNDTLIGNGGQDGLHGDAGDDRLQGGDEHDYLSGGGGKDTLFGNDGSDVLLGDKGDDWLSGGAGDELIYGGDGNDVIHMGAGKDLTDAGEGDDTIFGGAGDDALCGDEGNDVLWGEAGNDFLLGDDDKMLEPWGPDHVPGNDKMDGGDGNDTLMGSHESDTYSYDNGRDTMTGGKGDDYIDARGDDVLMDRSTGGAMGNDHVPVLDNHATSDAWVVDQTAKITITHRINNGGSVESIAIPAGVGKFGRFPTFFTTDDSGTIHMRDTRQREFKLGEFFENWGYDTADGRVAGLEDFEMYVNGQSTDLGPNLVVHAGDQIQISYGERAFR